jgi:hypothetical protein
MLGAAVAALASGMPVRAANGIRSLVALHFTSGVELSSDQILTSRTPGLRRLSEQGHLAVSAAVEGETGSVRYLPDGAVAHNISLALDSNAVTRVFDGGVTLTPIDGGDANAYSEGSLGTVFPDTPLGRHLATVARLIASGRGHAVYTVATAGIPANQELASRRLSELDAALSAFDQAMAELGRAQEVLLFSDVAAPQMQSRRSSPRFLVGGGVAGARKISARNWEKTLAGWAAGQASLEELA